MATLVMSIAPTIPMTDWKKQRSQVRASHSEKVCLESGQLGQLGRFGQFECFELKMALFRLRREGTVLCVKGDDDDGGDDLASNGKPEDEHRVVNVAQLSENQN